MRQSGLTFLTVVAIAALTGCGGGGGGKGRGASTAAGATPIRTMPSHRAQHTATLLPNGDVFVAGGVDLSGDPTASTVIITPTAVRSGPDMSAPRVGHSATLLSTGDVLVAGGSSDAAGATVLGTSELFDPVTSTFSAGPALVQARRDHVASTYVRSTGEFVLIAGGQAGQTPPVAPATTGTPILLDSVEVIDVALNTSAAIPQRLAAAQFDARIARLDTGGLLIVAGQAAVGSAPAQVFDPVGQSFTTTNVVVGRTGAAVLSRGREVLVAGGQSLVGLEDSTEVYDSVTRTFAQGARLGAQRRDAAVAAVGTNDVVVVGGRAAAGASARVEKLSGANLGQAQVTAIADLATAREEHTATAIGGTQLIVVGGFDAQGVALNTIETIDLAPRPATTGTTPGPIGPVVGANPLPTMPTLPTLPTAPTTPAPTPPPATGGSGGGLGGLLGGLFGGGSSGGSSGGSIGSTLLNAALQAAIQALTNNTGGGFSGFLQAFIQNLLPNLINAFLGGSSSGTSGSGGGLSGILGSLLGGLTGGSTSGSTGGSSGGIGSLLTGLLGSLTGGGSSGSTSGSSGGLGSLLTGLLGGLTGGSSGSTGSSGSSGGLAGLLGGLFGGGSGSTSSGSTAAPTVSALSPGSGAVGSTVTITGTNFSTTTAPTVVINGRAATVLSGNTSTSVRFVVPAGATTGAVTLTSNGQTVLAGNFTVL